MNIVQLLIPPSYLVEGHSMMPTLAHGHHVLARAGSKVRFRIQRGDIVALKHPLGENGIHIKRVVGLPDEYIQLKEDAVYIDELPLPEPYLIGRACPENRYARQWLNGPDEYFVMGDNRSDSLDSRYYGPVPVECMLDVVWYRCCPTRGLC